MFQTLSPKRFETKLINSEVCHSFFMQIRLVDYKEGVPVEVHEEYNPQQLDIEFVDLKYTSPLSLDATIEKGLDTLSFRGHVSSHIERVCGRCLVSIKDSIDEPFDLFYEIKGKEYIETLDDIREVLILDHPLAFVCKETCQGLCPWNPGQPRPGGWTRPESKHFFPS